MKLVNLTCPNCTAKIRPVSQKEPYVKCEYCESLFRLEGEQLLSTDLSVDTPKEEKKPDPNLRMQTRESAVQNNILYLKEKYKNEIPKQKKRMILSGVVGFLALGLYGSSKAGFFMLIFLAACYVFFSSLKKTRENDYLERRRKFLESGMGISRKDKSMAFLLCLFGGWFGAHCFYVGRIGRGVLYILTFGFFGVGWMIDIIKILFGTYRDKQGNIIL